MYNKLLIAVLLAALGIGMLAVGPRKPLCSRWILGGVGLMVLFGLPNLIYQAANGLPQLDMGRALAAHNGSSSRVFMWPFLLLMLGPPLVPIWLAGLVRLWRRPAVRFVAMAFPVPADSRLCNGNPVLLPGRSGVGAVRGRVRADCGLVQRSPGATRLDSGGVGLNAVVSLLLGLPLVPVSVLGKTPIPGINQAARDTVGWPTYVEQVRAVFDAMPPADRAQVQLVASNYGEAGALRRYGPTCLRCSAGRTACTNKGIRWPRW